LHQYCPLPRFTHRYTALSQKTTGFGLSFFIHCESNGISSRGTRADVLTEKSPSGYLPQAVFVFDV